MKTKKQKVVNIFEKGLIRPISLKPGMLVYITSTTPEHKTPYGSSQSIFKIKTIFDSSMRCELFGGPEPRRTKNYDGTYTILFYNSRVYKH